MASSNKKSNDLDIVRLNSVGISLSGIARRTNVHHTTVTNRLKILNISPADTRRSFMEDIFDDLNPRQQDWLMDRLDGGQSIKDFVKSLITKEYLSKNP